ncbi:hypothetical protein ACN47E_008901 [Coniothyrium glycines]
MLRLTTEPRLRDSTTSPVILVISQLVILSRVSAFSRHYCPILKPVIRSEWDSREGRTLRASGRRSSTARV